MMKWFSTIHAALFSGLIAGRHRPSAQAPAQGGTTAPTDAQVRELEQQIKSLQQQLDEIKAARDAAARQRLMQQNWHGMQNYMGQMHDRWGMGYPWMTGRSWMMMGPGMMGSGRTSWPVPQGLTPDQYSRQMRDHMQRMQGELNKSRADERPAGTAAPHAGALARHVSGHADDARHGLDVGRWVDDGTGMMGRGMRTAA